MISIKYTAKTQSSRVGVDAARVVLRHPQGCGAPSNRSEAKAPLRLLAVLALALVVLLATAASPALGAQRHAFSHSFGAPGAGAGQLSLLPGEPGGNNPTASGVAVNDATHDVYVADTGNHRVAQFEADGTFVRAWGFGVLNGESKFQTCTSACQAGISGANPGQFSKPTFLAVDNSAGPSHGDVYVADTANFAVFGNGGVITKFTSSGELVSTWGLNGQLGGSSVTPGGSFSEMAGIATSVTGGLFVINRIGTKSRASVFDQDGAFGEEFRLENLTAQQGLALDNSAGPSGGDLYAIRFGVASTYQFNPTGDRLSEPDPGPGNSLAVDSSNGDLYVSHAADVTAYSASGAKLGLFGSAEPSEGELDQPAGLGVDASDHTVYLADGGSQRIDAFVPVTTPGLSISPASDIEGESATLNGTLNPGGTTPDAEIEECRFEYVEDSVFQAEKGSHSADEIFAANGSSLPCLNPDGSATAPLAPDTADHPLHAGLTGLTPGVTYDFRLLARNVNLTESTSIETFTSSFPFLAPTIEATFATAVSSSSAQLGGEINPNHYPTAYRFEYVDNATYEEDLASGDGFQRATRAPVPDGSLAPAGTLQEVSQSIPGLSPSTAYRYRLIADNGHGESESSVGAFTTQPAVSGPALPDGRGWEMVSPPDKQGIPLAPISREGGLIQAADDGRAITYIAGGSIVSNPAGNRSAEYSQVLSARDTSGWSTRDVSTPHQQPVPVFLGVGSEYRFFSSDLSLAAIEPRGATPLSPETSERTPYLRLQDGTYQPLVTEANVPPGTHFGGEEFSPELFGDGVVFVTATPDLSHLLLESPTSLVEGFEPAGDGIYEWSAGTLTPVSFTPPAGETRCGAGAPACVAHGGTVGNGNQQMRNAISADGSRVVFIRGHAGSGELYLRDLPRGETLLLDAPQGGSGNAGAATFQFASADGSRVFFTDGEKLTPDSTAGGSSSGRPDLYMCEIVIEAGHLACSLTDLSANALNPSEPANIKGAVIGAAADGSSVYFVADGALTAGAVHGNCVFGGGHGSGECNLYRYDTETGLSLIAVLSGADSPDWAADGPASLQQLTARVSPNGRFLAFMSERSLTGYDNRDAASGQPDEEVFLYDSAAESGAGRLICASCNPTGARPAGREGPGNVPYALVDSQPNWGSRWYAANVPGWTNIGNQYALYQSRYLSDSGRLFFNASDALVPQDSNGTEDVYQYEPPGVGSCAEASPTFAPRNGGCLDLISSGTSGRESAFMDASESGDDVFFLTAARLGSADVDTALDLYDARVGGTTASPVEPVECSGDACQQPAVPPNDQTPGSLTFNGAGNVFECPKGQSPIGGKCVKPKSKKHKNKHHKKGHKKHKRTAHRNAGGSK